MNVTNLKRPTLSVPAVTVLVMGFILLTANMSFYKKGLEIFSGHMLSFVGLIIGVTLISLACGLVVSSKWLMKPLFSAFLIEAAAISYFADNYGVIVNRDMIQNAVTTTSAEAVPLLTSGFLLHLFIFGIIPVVILWWLKIDRKPMWQAFKRNAMLIAGCLIITVAIIGSNFATYASTYRERHDLTGSIVPAAAIISLIRYGKLVYNQNRIITVEALGTDAQFGPVMTGTDKPVLMVLVVGETARAANFSLNGYERPTNPNLEKIGVASFQKVTSCGTATAVSLPCMFSQYGRADYSNIKGLSQENVLDVLTHAGADVRWFDVNTGSKDVAKRIDEINIAQGNDPDYCRENECDDGIIFKYLDERIAEIKSGTSKFNVMVIHQIGSHGPAYWMRHPIDKTPFEPECRTAQFADCTPEAIMNAYDNTIAYTDFVLGEIISRLNNQTDMVTGMMYVSDHGESLGENGLYLHGAPYLFAPDTQTHVPWIMWLSDAYTKLTGISQNCLNTQNEISHDNYFDTVLGLLNINTSVYRSEMDVTNSCVDKILAATKTASQS